jgi:hypothetical protein
LGECWLIRVRPFVFQCKHITPVFFARHPGPEGSPFAESSLLTQLIPEMQMDALQDRILVKRYPNKLTPTQYQNA